MKKYKFEGIDGFVADTNTKALDIHTNGKRAVSFGMQKIAKPQLSEDSDLIATLAAEFMVDEFGAMTRPEIEAALMNSNDDIYSDWIMFANERGLDGAASQAAGWEIIFGNDPLSVDEIGSYF